MTTARDHMTADLLYALADTGEASRDFTWDGVVFNGIIAGSAVGMPPVVDNGFMVERQRLFVSAAGFPEPVVGAVHDLDGAEWEIDRTRATLPGVYEIELIRRLS